jgi:hypothetical protein
MATMKLQRVARQCESPICSHHRSAWRGWLDPVRGYSINDHWYCCPECFEHAVATAVAQFLRGSVKTLVTSHRIPIGLLMLSRGIVDNEQLKRALKAQKESGTGRVGEWLRQIGAVTEDQVTQCLGLQWSIPVFPLAQSRRFLDCAQLVPFSLLEVAEMLPVHHLPDTKTLYVAFVDRVNYSALYALEKMLDCHTEPCVAAQSQVIQAMNELRRRPRPVEALVNNISDPTEVAISISAHVARLGAVDVRISGLDSFVWSRVLSPSGYTDILFQTQNHEPAVLTLAEAG